VACIWMSWDGMSIMACIARCGMASRLQCVSSVSMEESGETRRLIVNMLITPSALSPLVSGVRLSDLHTFAVNVTSRGRS